MLAWRHRLSLIANSPKRGLVAIYVSILANWLGDKLMTAEAVRGGNRRYLVTLSLLLTAAGLAIPFVQSLAAIMC